jgi:enoyl-CoA hydratase/carnithine racemase
MCCDLRVASEKARFGLPEVGLAVIPGSGGTQRLPRLVGLGRAKEMVLTGRIIDAAAAADIGLVTRLAPAGQAESLAMEMAEIVAAKGPLAVREAKRLLDLALDLPLDDGLLEETEASGRVFDSDDLVEGARAFLEKRSPRFQGD